MFPESSQTLRVLSPAITLAVYRACESADTGRFIRLGTAVTRAFVASDPGGFMADLTQLKHIVVLMMENRSFDHMLGFLKKENPDLRGVLGNDYSNPSNAGPDVPVTDGAEYEGQLIIDPGHDFTDVYMQMYGVPFGSAPSQPDMSGFARSYEQMGGVGADIMRCFRPEQVPVLSALARKYCVCD